MKGRVLAIMVVVASMFVSSCSATHHAPSQAKLITGTQVPNGSPQGDSHPIKKPQVALATTTARSQFATEKNATLFAATAVLVDDNPAGSDTNTGYACPAGSVMLIRLYGTFPGIVTGGGPVPATSPPTGGGGYEAIVITANPANGKACRLGFNPGPISPAPPETVLFTH